MAEWNMTPEEMLVETIKDMKAKGERMRIIQRFDEGGEGSPYEMVHAKFVAVIREGFARDPDEFGFTVFWNDDILAGHLAGHLERKQIPHVLRAFDGKIGGIPARTAGAIEGKEVKAVYTFGVFHIRPGTEDEVFYYSYGPFDRMGRRIGMAAYRKIGHLNRLIADVKAGYKEEVGRKRVIVQADGDIVPMEPVRWEDVVLPKDLFDGVRMSVEGFLGGRSVYDRLGIPYKRGILLAGSPGNGKTFLCKAIAWESNLPFIVMPITRDTSEHDLDNVLDRARDLAPAIVCFEDIDSLSKAHLSKSYFLNRLDGFEALEGVLILGTTNKPEEIDAALRNRPSRFDSVFRIPNPDEECRARVLRRFFQESANDGLLEWMVGGTKGFTVAYLKELYLLAAMRALGRGAERPDREDAAAALETLRSQMQNSAKPLEDEENEKIGFHGFF